ncbi:hypothetical protein OTU49_016796 [Cherax quadricarinatus]|uniref:Uncharacterized protein n=1 Tax=Cherax quadricarinatus TaxID=27406 RepID=A0AAW0XS72_CHEQU|nr:uncharacterized protein LOC128703304 [Cherax quadricarinatus]
MEVLTLAGSRAPHQDVPMDLTTGSRPKLVLHHSWPRLRKDPKCALEPSTKLTTHAMLSASPATASRYIPIPKKRHCQARASPPSPPDSPFPKSQSPWISSYSPPTSTVWDTSNTYSPEVARKKARIESPQPSDLAYESNFRPPSAEEKNDATTNSSSSSSGGVSSDKRRELGAGPASGNGDRVEAGEVLSQSVMRPRQSQCSPLVESSLLGSSTRIAVSERDGVPGSHLLTALLHLQTSTISQGMLPPAALKDTEALLAAVHQSQMLYYTYCSQLIQNLQAKQLEQHHHHLQAKQLEQNLQAKQLEQHLQAKQLEQHQMHQHTRLDYETELETYTRLEDNKSDNYEDETEEDLNVTEEDRLTGLASILRARLNSQETPQPTPDPQSSSAGSPSLTLPSSTTGGEDFDLSPTESSAGARKRAPRALTGKHVRPGTGASASTLLTLRQKLQERQKYREVYGEDPPQPSKSSKTRSRKR